MKKFLFAVATLFLFGGCTKDEGFENIPEKNAVGNTPVTRIVNGSTHTGIKTMLGERMKNPYSLSNMRGSFVTLTSTRSEFIGSDIKANALYVRFLPRDMNEVTYLENTCSLTLFDYPLDYELEVVGDYYHDPNVPEGVITWLYTTVSIDFKFPPGIIYEVLEELYIPNFVNEKGRLISQPFDSDLECIAFQRCGYGNMVPAANPTPASIFDKPVNPTGRIRILDDANKQLVGLRFVKVLTRWGVNFSSTFTDGDGYYRIPRGYQCNPQYFISFENKRFDFKIYDNWGPVTPALHNMRYQSRYGYSVDLYGNSQAWDWGVINNAAVAYINECQKRKYALPPLPNLRIFCAQGQSYGGAPMLSKAGGTYDVNMAMLVDWMKFYLRLNINLVKKVLPDVIVGTALNNYVDIFKTTAHELSHASHFRQVGPAYWREYIRYILRCWNDGLETYGSKFVANNDRCGVGEIWGFFSGWWFYQYYYHKETLKYPNDIEAEYWFKPQILWDIATRELLTTNEIFRCLTPDVTSLYLLKEKMKTIYPIKAHHIEETFSKYYSIALIDIDVPVELE